MTRYYNVVMEVEVLVDVAEGWGITKAQDMARMASAHNQCDPRESSVLYLPGVGHAEVVDQKVKKTVEVIRPNGDTKSNR